MVVNTLVDEDKRDDFLSLREAVAVANGTIQPSQLTVNEGRQLNLPKQPFTTITFAQALYGSAITLNTVGANRVGPSRIVDFGRG